MEKISYYKFAYGSIENIKQGNFGKVQVASSFPELEIPPITTKIVVPKLVGVYQEWKLTQNIYTMEDSPELEGIERINKLQESFIQEGFKYMIEDFGKKEDCHPHLIHICYDPKIMQFDLVRSFFESRDRLGFSLYDNIPDFDQKNSEGLYDIIHRWVKARNDMDPSETRKIAQEGCLFLNVRKLDYGLTREEYVTLQQLDRFRGSQSEQPVDPTTFKTYVDPLSMASTAKKLSMNKKPVN